MTRPITIVLAFFLAWGAALRAEAQSTVATQGCPPGQPCVVVVGPQAPQPQPQPVVQAYEPPPRRPVVERRGQRLRWALVAPGIGFILGGWVSNVVLASTGGVSTVGDTVSRSDANNYFGWSWFPWIGPFVDATYFDVSRHAGYITFHLLFGLLQVGGLVFCILGTALQEEVVETRYGLRDDHGGPTLSVLPYVNETGGGVMARVTGF